MESPHWALFNKASPLMILLAWFNCMYFWPQEVLQSALVLGFVHVWVSSSFPYIWTSVTTAHILLAVLLCNLVGVSPLCPGLSWKHQQLIQEVPESWLPLYSFSLEEGVIFHSADAVLALFQRSFLHVHYFFSAFIVVFLVPWSIRATPFQLHLALLHSLLFLAHLENCHKA